MRYASFGKRLKAYHADAWVVTFLTLLLDLSVPGASAQGMEEFAQQLQAAQQLAGADPVAVNSILQVILRDLYIGLIVSAIYNIAFVASRWQATPGKRWCGIKVISANGARPSLAQSLLRHAACGVSSAMFLVGYFTVLWSREKTAVHDILSNTRVIYTEEA